MATSKLKPTPGFKQPKFPVYQALYQLNQAFETIHINLEILDDYEAFPLALLQQFGATAQELRAGINHSVISRLDQREIFDWGMYGKRRMAHEKKFRD